MDELLGKIMKIMRSLDEEDFDDFDVDIDTNVRNIKSSPSSGRKSSPRRRNSNRRKSSKHDKSGSDKFKAKRRIKKLNRLMKKAEKQGLDVGHGIQEEPMVRKYTDGDSTTIQADRSDAMIDIDNGTATVSFERISASESFDIDFDNPDVEKNENQGITRFRITEA